MRLRTTLIAAAALSALASGAHAAPPRKRPATTTNAALLEQIRALRAEVAALREQVDAQQKGQAEAAARIDRAQAKAEQAQTEVAAAVATPPVTHDQVAAQIAGAIEREHHADTIHFKGITITPGGYLELAGIYRDHFQGNDIGSSFNIPFPNNRPAHEHEGRFSARQSRLSFLAQGNVNPDVTLAMFGDFDFLGGAQTANSNQSNSFNLRVRDLYGTIDWAHGGNGLHLLAGQIWSLVTMNSKGITPRNEVTPPQIDAQYVPGFFWARQPGVRLAGDFLDHRLWLAVSAENPQTTFGGTVPASVTNAAPAGSGFDSANTLSLNHVPDLIAKAAYEANAGGHGVHVEGFVITRAFEEHFNGGGNSSARTLGYGGSIGVQVAPGLIDAQFSGFGGKGIGRYGSAGLPDVTFSGDGRLHPISEYMLLAGLTLHASRQVDIYGFAGEEHAFAAFAANDGTFGYGNPLANNGGCFVEGGTCAGSTRRIRQLTLGLWDKFYQGAFGRAQVGVQYSYTQRQLFEGVGGMPQTGNSMGFVAFRYYPF